MNILFLTPYLPSPPRSGGPRRLRGLIAGLAERHSVSVLSLDEPGEDRALAVQATREYCDEVVTVTNPRYGQNGVPNPRKRQHQLQSMFSTGSYERMVYHQPALQAQLDQMVRRRHYDIINVEFSLMAHYRLPLTSRLVLDEHNIEYDILYRTQKVERQALRKLYGYVNYLKLRREEQAAWRKFDGCTLTSVRDERVLQRDCPTLPTAVIPNAVDAEAFAPMDVPTEPLTILFFGAMDYYPNTEGMIFFLKDVFPTLKQRYPSLKLQIVGQAPPEAITRWASDDVTVTGFVDDLRPYVARASAVIAPLRIGGGTRLKIVEAMSMGKAIVSTSIGAEGIDVSHEENILVADAPDAFAAQVGRLLDDQTLARRLGEGARRLVETRYTWRASVNRLDNFYRALLAMPTPIREPLVAVKHPPKLTTVWQAGRPAPAAAANSIHDSAS